MCTTISLQPLQRENFFGNTYGQNLGGIVGPAITTAGAKYSEELIGMYYLTVSFLYR